VLPTGLPTAMLREPVIPLEGISESGFALAMWGHIHVAGMIAAGPTAVGYCGTPYVCNWAEAEQPHGVWIYESGESALRFVEVPDNRRFLTLDWEPYDDFAGVDVAGAVVRVRYTVSEEESRRVDQNGARQILMDAGATKVVFRPTIVREQRARVEEISDDLTETAALDLWLTAQSINGDTAAALHAAHAEYLGRLA
jgi:exonuclease SbcD